MDAFTLERRQSLRRLPNVALEDEAYAEARERGASMISKKRLRFANIETRLIEMLLKQPGRLGPEWTDAFFAAFTEKRHRGRRGQAKVGGFQGDDFLHSRPGIEKQDQENVIPFTGEGRPIDAVKNDTRSSSASRYSMVRWLVRLKGMLKTRWACSKCSGH